MKKFSVLLAIVCVLILIAFTAYCADICVPGKKTSSGVAISKPGILVNLAAVPDGTNSCKCVALDGITSGGSDVFPSVTVDAGLTNTYGYVNYNGRFNTGLYITVTGTNCTCYYCTISGK